MDITEYEEFYKWYKANERRFHTSQMTEVEIAYSSYLHGIKQAGIKPDILQAEASAGAAGAAVGKAGEAKGVSDGKDNRNLFEGLMDADLGRE